MNVNVQPGNASLYAAKNRINLNVENGVKILKQYYHCDTMFRAQGFLWLCNEVKDIEYEEI